MGKLPLLAGCEAGPLHQPLGMTGLTGFLLPTGPLLQTSDGKEMEEGTIRYLVQPRGPCNMLSVVRLAVEQSPVFCSCASLVNGQGLTFLSH